MYTSCDLCGVDPRQRASQRATSPAAHMVDVDVCVEQVVQSTTRLGSKYVCDGL